ncbi:MAG: hypothetical protein ACK479_12255 [Fluviicola sp.]
MTPYQNNRPNYIQQPQYTPQNNSTFNYDYNSFKRDISNQTNRASNALATVNPFKIVKISLVLILLAVIVIFAKTIINWVMDLFGQKGSFVDLLTGQSDSSKSQKGYDKETEKQGQQTAKEEAKAVDKQPVSWYKDYLNVSNVKVDARSIVDFIYKNYNGANWAFTADMEAVAKINGLANRNKDELILICRYWDKKYSSAESGESLYIFLLQQNSLKTWTGEWHVQPLLSKLVKYNLTKKVQPLKK